jgi:large conductance mechanosensitive channel
MIKGFRDFIMRGNVVDLAVAVIIAVAFGAVITSFVDDVLMQLIAAIVQQSDFSALSFGLGGSEIYYGRFLNAVFAFLLVAAAVYFAVITPMNTLAERRAKGADPTTKQCPECLSEIPAGARKCAFCGSPQHDSTLA